MSGRITIAEFRGTNPLEQEEELISKMLKEGRITQDEATKLKEAIFGQEGS
jgi:polyhydroxyalkanoate synthesis regulator phasin